MKKSRLGVDIGGTFTDFSLLDEETGELIGLKSPSTPNAPVEAVDCGLKILFEERKIVPGEIDHFVHGGTVAVNTLIERNGANLCLFATEGFVDVLEIRRLRMPDVFDLLGVWPASLIPREQCIAIHERIGADGSVILPLDKESVDRAIEKALNQNVEGIVVGFLNSYKNASHELQVKELILKQAPQLAVTCSSEIWPEIREYERTIIAVINAYVSPKMNRYLGSLETVTEGRGIRVKPYITKSNGGVMTVGRARRRGAEVLVSGLASGVVGASYAAKEAGYKDLITMDMGGTSCDIGLIQDGQPRQSTDEYVGDFPIAMPVVSVSSIGAGGSSIAWVDPSGVLKVGPGSAGSDPGPACYARGGEGPTVTDAYLVCGFLNPDNFAGGRMKLHKELSETALTRLGNKLNLDMRRAAQAVLEVATANMYAGINRTLSMQGLDARDLTLMPFGGAGATHACFVAREFNFRDILVPSAPGTLCALGSLCCDIRAQFIKSVSVHFDKIDIDELRDDFRRLKEQAVLYMKEEGLPFNDSMVHLSLDMNYVGQAFYVDIPIFEEWLCTDRLREIESSFHKAHHQRYSHSDETAPTQIMNIRITVIGDIPKPMLKELGQSDRELKPACTRMIYYDRKLWNANVYSYGSLLYGDTVIGPAVIEHDDTTTVILDGFTATVDRYGNIVVGCKGGY